jgi:uncharacterized protein
VINQWIGLRDFDVPRRWAGLLAAVAFMVYFGSVILGAEAQEAMLPNLNMGWVQQILSAIVVLGLALWLREPKKLLGLCKPEGHWLMIAIGLGLALAVLGELANQLAPTPMPPLNAEYFAYEATMPGIGEELGFRGLFLGLLMTAGLQRGWPHAGRWVMLAVSALPFGLLHLIEMSGFQASVMFSFTFLAGIAFAWCRMVTASIWPCIIAHNATNVAGGLITFAFAG